MKEEEIDIAFNEKLKNKDNIPLNLTWNKEKGWLNLEKSLSNTHNFKYSWSRIAIVAAILAAGLWSGFFLQRYYSTKSLIDSEADLAIKEINLPSGHHCTLAPYSKIQFVGSSHAGNSDTLYLEGEAYIESFGEKLLVVKAKNSIAKCIGARLNIKASITDRTVVISAISGNVTAFCTDNNFPALKVSPMEQYTILEDGLMAFKTKNNDPNYLAWKTGTLTFDNVPLVYAVKIMEDYYGVCIKIEKDDLKYCRISSQMKNLTLKEAFRSIEKNLNLTIEKEGLMYMLSGKGCYGHL